MNILKNKNTFIIEFFEGFKLFLKLIIIIYFVNKFLQIHTY